MTRDEMHIKALSKGVDSQKIKGSMTVVLLGHAVDMMMELQDQHEAQLKAKDERIEAQSSVIIACQNAILQKDERITELETERDKYNTIAANLQISRQKAYDNIAELEAKIQNMCAECECAKFADNAIKPSEMWKLHLALKDNK